MLDQARFEQHASVALVLAPDADDLSLLFIQRREHAGDRWSGHAAFPGGRLDACDADSKQAAMRETYEEVGVDLTCAAYLGRLDDLAGRSESIVVSGFVFGLAERAALELNYEVAASRWLELSQVEATERHAVRAFDYLGQELYLPALEVFDPPAQALWGLSYRFLELFMRIIDRPIPSMPWDEDI